MTPPNMITDLAVMLLTAGFVTILFKKINQPLILGYILAGFLISPYFPLFFNVEDMTSIHLWSEIGVIILMFYIGLEFNLLKLAQMGGTAVTSALVKILGVILTGFFVGQLLGFSTFNCIFLGCMLSISSTAVIQKSFEEMGIKNEKYAQLVMGTLIIEDILAIFMLVILSTISVSQNVSGPELVINLSMMLCYLVVWLILGIYTLPVFLNKVIDLMTDEMLLILSLGVCFGMVLIANFLGFSSELGAFLAGSLLAGTMHAERIEHITKGVKDMFVSIFFLSVGMMVDPAAIASYAPMIILITIVAVISKLIFATMGMVLSGQTMHTAIKSGFSLAPIGEFSFIIASLGVSLGVMDAHLYPIIVSAAVITTFLTPFLIKNSDRSIAFVYNRLPEALVTKLNQYTSSDQTEDAADQDWNAYIRRYISRIGIYGIIMLVASISGIKWLQPFLLETMGEFPSELLTTAGIFLIIAIFIRPMMDPHNNHYTCLWLKKKSNHLPLMVMTFLKLVLVSSIAIMPLYVFFDLPLWVLVIICSVYVLIMAKSEFFCVPYLTLETTFLRNLNERIIENASKEGNTQHAWLNEELYIISVRAPEDADYLGVPLASLQWGKRFNVYVVKIKHGEKQIILPGPKVMIQPRDKVYVLGDLKAIENFYRLVNIEPPHPPRTLKEFMDSGYADSSNALAICAIQVTGTEAYVNKPLRAGIIRSKWHCAVLGLQKDGYPIIMPDSNTVIRKNDLIWVMGSNTYVGALVAESSLQNAFEEAMEHTKKL
ncbi:MAG: cation:proton antiporter [Bacillota bacterium]|nr:cation:proton antiporter [Bacillota bacterium]